MILQIFYLNDESTYLIFFNTLFLYYKSIQKSFFFWKIISKKIKSPSAKAKGLGMSGSPNVFQLEPNYPRYAKYLSTKGFN